VLGKHPQFKGHYLKMDNASIHTNEDMRKNIESHNYGCVDLPPYSPELNPAEQFWSAVKSKLKRVRLLEEEHLTERIQNATNQVLYSDLEGFCRSSDSKFAVCCLLYA
jgi:transposase